jgi:hypothetical protein
LSISLLAAPAIGQCELASTEQWIPSQIFQHAGWAVSVRGDVAVVGGQADLVVPASAAAWVYRRTASGWAEEQYLQPPAHDEGFGHAVAIDGQHLIVASRDAGVVYFYRRSAGIWTLVQQESDVPSFGTSVALHGNKALVGHPTADAAGPKVGAVFYYKFDGTEWNRTNVITPVPAESFQEFGLAVDFDGNHAIVGSLSDDGAGLRSGSAYVFVHGPPWQQVQKLKPAGVQTFHQFGHAVSIEGGLAVVGAPFSSIAGAAFVFEDVGGVWTERQSLSASGASSPSGFGRKVELDDDRIVVAAPELDAVFAFRPSAAGTWLEGERLIPSVVGSGERFGHSLAIDARTVLVGFDRSFTGSTEVYDLSDLHLEVTPAIATLGDTIELRAFCGSASTPFLLAVSAVQQVPTFVPVFVAPFGADQAFTTSATVPAGIGPLDLELKIYGQDLGGHFRLSPGAPLVLQ